MGCRSEGFHWNVSTCHGLAIQFHKQWQRKHGQDVKGIVNRDQLARRTPPDIRLNLGPLELKARVDLAEDILAEADTLPDAKAMRHRDYADALLGSISFKAYKARVPAEQVTDWRVGSTELTEGGARAYCESVGLPFESSHQRYQRVRGNTPVYVLTDDGVSKIEPRTKRDLQSE